MLISWVLSANTIACTVGSKEEENVLKLLSVDSKKNEGGCILSEKTQHLMFSPFSIGVQDFIGDIRVIFLLLCKHFMVYTEKLDVEIRVTTTKDKDKQNCSSFCMVTQR